MIVDSDVRRFESNATVQTNAFQIAASPKAFSILSSQLYANKPRAIIRELAANAADAHTASGNKEPFLIEFPSSLNPSFRIRDFGTGLSDEGIKTLYTTYFGSNKTASNEQIGGLGLGSKSPFAYTDQFTVTSFFNGTKSIYQAFIGEDSVPQIALIAAEMTTESNGIEVVIPIKQQDVYDFANEVDVLRFFDPLPTTALAIPALNYDHTFNIDDVKVCMRTEGGNQATLVQGPIPYPITASQNLTSYPNWRIFQAPIDIIVPVGFCEIAASREGLSYNKATIARLSALGDKIIEALRLKIQTAVADATDLADAYKTLQATSKLLQTATSTINTQVIVWKGHNLTVGQHFPIDLPDGVVARVIHRNDSWGSKKPFVANISEHHVMLSASQHNTQFFRREKGGAFYSYFEELRNNADANINHARYIILEGATPLVDKLVADYHLKTTEFPKLKAAVGAKRTAKNLGKTQYYCYHYAAGDTEVNSRMLTANDILQLDPGAPIYTNVDVGGHEALRALMTIRPPLTIVSVQDSHTKVIEAFKETQLDTTYAEYVASFVTKSLVERAYIASTVYSINQTYIRKMGEMVQTSDLPTEGIHTRLYQLATAAGLGPVALELIENLKQHTIAPSLLKVLKASGTAADGTEGNRKDYALDIMKSTAALLPMYEAVKASAVTPTESDTAKAVSSLAILRSHFPMIFSNYFIGHLNNNNPHRYYYSNKNQSTIHGDVEKFIKDYIMWANAKRTDPAIDATNQQPTTQNEEYGYAA